MLKRYVFLLLAAFHLALVALYNIHSILSEHGYQLLKPCFRVAEKVPAIQQYLMWSGAETVYGFFAPRVGSQHMLVLHTKEAATNSYDLIDYPLFNTKEAKFRYISFLDQLEDRLRSKDPVIRAYGRALLRGLASEYEKLEDAKPVNSLSLHVIIQAKLAEAKAPNVYKKIYQLSM